MDSAINLEKPESLLGLPATNLPLSPTSADAPLLELLGRTIETMNEDELRRHVDMLRTLRKTPQKLTAKLSEGTEKTSRKKAVAAKVEGASMAASYMDMFKPKQ